MSRAMSYPALQEQVQIAANEADQALVRELEVLKQKKEELKAQETIVDNLRFDLSSLERMEEMFDDMMQP